jgi:hypothetical protein
MLRAPSISLPPKLRRSCLHLVICREPDMTFRVGHEIVANCSFAAVRNYEKTFVFDRHFRLFTSCGY